jgi:peptidoglycan-associated lipoprotein
MERFMKRIITIIGLAAGAMLLAGCPKKPTVQQPPSTASQVPASSSMTGSGGGASTTVTPLGGDGSGAGGAGGAGVNGPLSGRVIYFDFDKAEIRAEFADLITTFAKNLTAHPNLKLRLEGNTDERGTREYNIGLGERRAQAVRRALMLQGVAEGQLSTVSYGAERPAAEGDDESAWSLNRRVELVYLP